jgi:hypothetical protein
MPTEIDGAVVVISGTAAGFPSPHSRSEWRGGVRGGGACAFVQGWRCVQRPPRRRCAAPPSPPLASLAGGGKLPNSCFALPKE